MPIIRAFNQVPTSIQKCIGEKVTDSNFEFAVTPNSGYSGTLVVTKEGVGVVKSGYSAGLPFLTYLYFYRYNQLSGMVVKVGWRSGTIRLEPILKNAVEERLLTKRSICKSKKPTSRFCKTVENRFFTLRSNIKENQ